MFCPLPGSHKNWTSIPPCALGSIRINKCPSNWRATPPGHWMVVTSVTNLLPMMAVDPLVPVRLGNAGTRLVRAFNLSYCLIYSCTLLAYLLVALLLSKWHSRYIVYRPNVPPTARSYVTNPSEAGWRIDTFEELWITSLDGTRLHAYLLK